LISEGEDRFSKAFEPTDKDKEVARKQQKLEDEDQIRAEQIDGVSAVLETCTSTRASIQMCFGLCRVGFDCNSGPSSSSRIVDGRVFSCGAIMP